MTHYDLYFCSQAQSERVSLSPTWKLPGDKNEGHTFVKARYTFLNTSVF